MSLNAGNLVGYMRAEFAKSGRLRTALFFLQLAAALPGAFSVVVPDDQTLTLYALAVIGLVLLVVWWALNTYYASARSAAQAARRAAVLSDGLGKPFSPGELLSLRDRFTVSPRKAAEYEMADYYASKLPVGPARLAELIEESAYYSERLQRLSANVMLGILALFAVVFLGIAIGSLPYLDRATGFIIARVFLAVMVFVLSSDLLGAYRAHKAAAQDIRDIRMRLQTADRAGYPEADVLLAFLDYNAAVEGAPESVPYVYERFRDDLASGWAAYQRDLADERQSRARA